ncbi:MAG: hypothetical protein IKP40_14180 [Clostridia bacterium]|nr:hypothetical protein [Clostridia bacterium]
MNKLMHHVFRLGCALLMLALAGPVFAEDAASATLTPLPLPEASATPLPETFQTPMPSLPPYPPLIGERVVVWRVIPPAIDTSALLEEAFGAEAQGIQKEEQDYGSICWNLSEEGLPLCSLRHRRGAEGIQMDFEIVRRSDWDGERVYLYNLDEWNAIPEESGFDAPQAAETTEEGIALLSRLGLYTGSTAAAPISYSTLGRMEGTAKCRKTVFAETLEGLPLRWSAAALRGAEEVRDVVISRCYVQIAFSDEDGLLMADGSWCGFEPLERASAILSPEEAAARFRQVLPSDEGNTLPVETCWFLSLNHSLEATATLAYRMGNSYLSAAEGVWLQTE